MYEILPRSSGNVLGLKFSGRLSHAEYKSMLPYIYEKIDEYQKVRLLLELNHFEGWDLRAALDDVLFAVRHHSSIERLALVTDTAEDQWMALVDQPFGRVGGGKERLFKASELEKAWDWLEHGRTTVLNIDPTQYKGPVRCGSKQKVLIVGAGITGLTLAALLQQRGFEPTLVSRDVKKVPYSFLVNLWPTCVQIFESLGLSQQLHDCSTPLKKYLILDEEGNERVSYSTDTITQKHGPILRVEHAQLKKILRSLLAPNRYLENVTIQSIHQENDADQVTFSDGSTKSYDLVVACDGSRSLVRKLIFGKPISEPESMRYWSFVIRGRSIDATTQMEYWSEDRVVTIGSHPNQLHGVVGLKHDLCTFEEPEKIQAALLYHFGGFNPAIRDYLNVINPNDFVELNYKQLRMPKFVKGRVVLIGDAAVSTAPTNSIGAFLGIESAYALCEEIARSNSQYIGQALHRFEQRITRRLHTMRPTIKRYEGITESPSNLVTRWIGRFSEQDFIELWDDILSNSL